VRSGNDLTLESSHRGTEITAYAAFNTNDAGRARHTSSASETGKHLRCGRCISVALTRSIWSSILLLGLVTAAGIILIGVVHRCTEARIEAHARELPLRRFATVLPPRAYDNDILATERRIDARTLNIRKPAHVYVARRNGKPVAAIFDLVTPEGYNGPIRLLIGVRRDGTVSGVRVVSHRETPGLGDAVETDQSDWILQFTGRSLRRPPAQDWEVAADGGAFDQISGATITSRGVVGAVRRALLYFADHRKALFARSTRAPNDR
jgi:Na+-translocating ferredoxin:NAD+ oxidoreductase subunit G